LSDSETEFTKPGKSNASADHSDPSENENENQNENGDYVMESEDSDSIEDEDQKMKVEEPVTVPYPVVEEENEDQTTKVEEPVSPPAQDEVEGTGKRRFLDLNELAPSPGFDDGPNTIVKDEDNDY
jgi:hypothetical protein